MIKLCLLERGLVWELEVEDSLEEEEELSSSLSLLICRVDKRGSLSVLVIRACAGLFWGRLLVEITDDVSEEFTGMKGLGFIAARFTED